MSESEFINKVKTKLENNRVTNVVKQIETPPTKELKIDIPQTPFTITMEDDMDTDELSYKQTELFRDYLKRNKYRNFNSWWEEEGKEELSDVYNEAIINNEKITDDGNISKWWRNYLQNNLSQIIRQLKFMKDMGVLT